MSSTPKKTFKRPLIDAHAPETMNAAAKPTKSVAGALLRCAR